MSELLTALLPFGSLDVQACESALDRFGISYYDFAEFAEEFCEDTGTPFVKLDICALAYEIILQRARSLIARATGKDIEIDCGICMYGNYMCSCFDRTEKTIELLESKAGKALREEDDFIETFYQELF